MTEDPNTSVFCQFPFSWVLKAYLEELWERVYNMKGNIRLFKQVLFFNPGKLISKVSHNSQSCGRSNHSSSVPHTTIMTQNICCALLFSCQLQFSGYLASLSFPLGHPKVPMKEPAKLFQTLIKDVLMPDDRNSEMMQCYTNDFLRMTFPGQDLSVYEVNGVWWSTGFKWHWLESQGYRYLWF